MSSQKAGKTKPARKVKGSPNSIHFAVTCKGFPGKMLTPEQGSLVESELLKKFSKSKHKEEGNFQSIAYDSAKGYVLVKCSRVKARLMVKGVLPQIKPWPGAFLRIVKLRKTVYGTRAIYSCRFPDSFTYTWLEIRMMLQKQNEDLRTNYWKFIRMDKIDSDKMVVVYVTLDAKSVATVENHGGMLNYKSCKIRVVKCGSNQDCEPLNDDSYELDGQDDDDEDLLEDNEDDSMPEPNRHQNSFNESCSGEQNRETSANQGNFSGNSSGNSFNPNRSGSNWNENGDFSGNCNDNFSNNSLPNCSGNYAQESFNQNFSDNSSGNFSQQPGRSKSLSQNRFSGNWNGNGNSCGGSSSFARTDFGCGNSSNSGNSFGGNGNFPNEGNSFNRAQYSSGGGNWSDHSSTSYGAADSMNRNSSNWNRNGNSSGNWNRNDNFCSDNSSGDFSQQRGRNNSHIQNRSGGNWNGNDNWNRNGNSWDGSDRSASNGSFSNAGNSFNNFTGGSNWSNRPSFDETANPGNRNRSQFYGSGNNRGNSFF